MKKKKMTKNFTFRLRLDMSLRRLKLQTQPNQLVWVAGSGYVGGVRWLPASF